MTQTSKLDVLLNFIKTGTGSKDATKSLKGLDQATKGADKSTRKFSIGQAAAAIGLTAMTLNVIRQLPELAQLGFRYQNARIALEAYTGSAQSATDVTDAISEASGFAVSKMEAVANATRIVSLGLVSNAEEAAEFTRVAVTLGATMGKDVQGAFEEFSLLLANESILRLDTYGISGAKVREEMARLAAVFPEMDRNARFTNATMTIAAEKMDKLDEAGFQATSAIDRMTARLGDAKVEFASFANEVAANLLNPIFDTADAHKEASVAILENVDTYQEYKAALTEAGIVGGLFTDSTASLSEEQFNQAKAAQAAAEAQAELTDADLALIAANEKVILTTGGINELLQEEAFLSKALSLGIAGSLTKAIDKIKDVDKEIDEVVVSIGELGTEMDEGTVTAEEYEEALDPLVDKYLDLQEESDNLARSLERTTAELIFQSAAADLDAETSLLLARELGLVDEATFAVTQEAQRLRIQLDEGAISAEEFAAQAGNLADNISEIQSRDVEITVETLRARQEIDRLNSKLAGVRSAVADLGSSFGAFGDLGIGFGGVGLPGGFGGGFQDGADFTIPDSGLRGDRVPVAFMAEQGERVQVTPNGGNGSGPLIGIVNVGSDMDIAFLINEIQKSR